MQYKNQSVLFPISSRYERYCTAKRHLRERSGGEVFPVGETNKAITRQQPKEKESKNEVTQTITATYHKGGKGSHIQQLNQPKHSNDRVYSDKGLSPTLNTMQGGNRSPFVVQQDEVWKYIDNWNEYMISSKGRLYSVKSNLFPTSFLGYFNSKENAYNKYFDEFIKLNKYEPWRRQPFIKNPLKGKTKYGWHFEQNVFDETGISRSLKASEGSGNRLKIIKPTLTPNRAKKRQKGRRMKEDGEPMFTLTGQDVHGVTIIDKKGNPKNKNHASTLTGGGHSGGNHSDMDLLAMRWQRTEKGKNARKESQKQGRDYTPFSDGHRELVPVKGKPVGALTAQAVAKDSLIGNHTRIRRLTPTECERLQGFEDGFTEFGIDNNYHIRYNKSSNKLDLCKQSTIKKLNSKNVQWKIVKENKLPILVTASCIIKDGKGQEQLNLLKKSFNEIKNVNIAIKKLEKSGQWECVINIIKCGETM